jgi:hypothetical protein
MRTTPPITQELALLVKTVIFTVPAISTATAIATAAVPAPSA